MRTIKRAIVVLLMAALCAALFAPAALAVDPYAPIITSQTTGPIKVKPGKSITLQVEAESPAGLPLEYRWYEIYSDGTLDGGKLWYAQYQETPFAKERLRPFKAVEDRLFYCVVFSQRIDPGPLNGGLKVHTVQSEVIRVQCDYGFWDKVDVFFRYILGILQAVFTFPIMAIVAFFV